MEVLFIGINVNLVLEIGGAACHSYLILKASLCLCLILFLILVCVYWVSCHFVAHRAENWP